MRRSLYWLLPWTGLSQKPTQIAWSSAALMLAALAVVVAMKVLDLRGLLSHRLMVTGLLVQFAFFGAAVFAGDRAITKAKQKSWEELVRRSESHG